MNEFIQDVVEQVLKDCAHTSDFHFAGRSWKCNEGCGYTMNFDPFIAGLNRHEDWRCEGVAIILAGPETKFNPWLNISKGGKW